jgi:hypothetical protein
MTKGELRNMLNNHGNLLIQNDLYARLCIDGDIDEVRKVILNMYDIVSGMAIVHGVTLPITLANECNKKERPEGTGESKQNN